MYFQINLESWIDSFDTITEKSNHCVSAVTSMVGEELAIQSFRHFLSVEHGIESRIISGTVSRRGKSGCRLDAWLETRPGSDENVLYQIEVKNWSAHSLHGRTVDESVVKTKGRKGGIEYVMRANMLEEWSDEHGLTKANTAKVLEVMSPPKGAFSEQRPLLVFWMPIGNIVANPHTVLQVPSGRLGFTELEVFSVSLYFRSLIRRGVGTIELELPSFAKKRSLLDDLVVLISP